MLKDGRRRPDRGRADVESRWPALSRLADATLAAALRLAEEERGATPRLAVIAMGKCGGRELNYVSDVDVIFVCAGDEDLGDAQVIAARMMQICAQAAWPVDANLRPEGSQGPLVRTLASHEAYYRRWARTWEFQALLKARPAAGDLEVGARWLAMLDPLIWHAAERPEAVEDVRAMRRRIIDSVPPDQRDREIKRGPGGLRDIEFAVQLLQLVHGRGDEQLRLTVLLWTLCGRCRSAAMWAVRTGTHWSRRTGSCASWSTACSCNACAAPTWCRTRGPRGARPPCVGSPRRSVSARTPAVTRFRCSARPGSRTRTRYAGYTRSWSTGRWWRPWPGYRATRCD